MAKSEPKATFLDLPEGILARIFDYFSEDIASKALDDRVADAEAVDAFYRLDGDKDDFRTIQALRRVCRTFNSVASPLLVPVVRVSSSLLSLDRVFKLTRNPKIASGIHLVQVSLAYRPKCLASGWAAFAEYQLERLEAVASQWNRQLIKNHADKNETDRILSAVAEIQAVLRGPETPPETQPQSEWHPHILQWFEEYKRQHRWQFTFLSSGLFSDLLCAYMCKMDSLKAVCFIDYDLDGWNGVINDYLDIEVAMAISARTDLSKLGRFMVMSQTWRELEDMAQMPAIESIRVLWELPMRLHCKGRPLRNVTISALPTLPSRSNFPRLLPSGASLSRIRQLPILPVILPEARNGKGEEGGNGKKEDGSAKQKGDKDGKKEDGNGKQDEDKDPKQGEGVSGKAGEIGNKKEDEAQSVKGEEEGNGKEREAENGKKDEGDRKEEEAGIRKAEEDRNGKQEEDSSKQEEEAQNGKQREDENRKEEGDGNETPWSLLRQAFEHVEHVRVGGRGIMSGQPLRAEHLAGKERECLNNYLAALLSSPRLRRIDLTGYPFMLNPGKGVSMTKRLYPIGPVFQNGPSYEHLTTLDICGVSFREDELLEFLQRIRATELCEVNFDDVGLDSGKASKQSIRYTGLPSHLMHKISINELDDWETDGEEEEEAPGPVKVEKQGKETSTAASTLDSIPN
ncbi:hypothetical protein QBC47DRAFT_443408 [Echria macrotheca]|uniref:Uncharacterized protein n=1 Tax=Echria macrotheca TaxID=438768 RepID=A0AAJ0BGF9_9PEZI|nr:hypothetical protein QBC47DRAFT_443408 [Echria macrotheca]